MKKTVLLLLFAASFNSRAQGTLNSGLVGRFPFDNSLTDATGNIANFSNANVAYGPDAHSQANTALRLVSNGEVSIDPVGLLDFGTTGSFTFSVAFRTLASSTQVFFSNQGSYAATSTTDSRGWSLGFDNAQVGKVYLNLVRNSSTNGGLGLATQASFNDGLWHTAVLVVNRSSRQIRLFVDGTAQALTYVSINPTYGTVTGSTFTLSSTATMFVDLTPGYSLSLLNINRPNNRFGLNYNGWLDEARFYNRVLTDGEVQTLSGQVLATLSAQEAAAQVKIAPNPVSGTSCIVTLAKPLAASQLRLVDLLGRTVPVTIVSRQAGSQVYELRGLNAGLYLLHVTLEQGLAVQRVQVN